MQINGYPAMQRPDVMSKISGFFTYPFGFTLLTLTLFGGIKGQFTGINKAKSAGQTVLVGRARRIRND